MTEDLGELSECIQAIDDVTIKLRDITRMVEQLEKSKLQPFEEEALYAFQNVQARYTVILGALKKRKEILESS